MVALPLALDSCCDVLQTLMLAKITPRQFKNSVSPYTGVALPDVDANPHCSNIYSIGERIILAWLNQHYEQMRTRVWSVPNVKGTLMKRDRDVPSQTFPTFPTDERRLGHTLPDISHRHFT